MVRVERIRKLIPSGNGIHHAVLDLQVSTVAELPALGSKVEEMVIDAGSIAQIVQADSPTFVTLDDDGTWYPEQSDSSASSLNASLSMSPTLNKAIANSTDDTIDLTENDIDRISDELEQAETPVKEQKKSFAESVEEPEQDGDDDADIL